jgi:hypothetical protein
VVRRRSIQRTRAGRCGRTLSERVLTCRLRCVGRMHRPTPPGPGHVLKTIRCEGGETDVKDRERDQPLAASPKPLTSAPPGTRRRAVTDAVGLAPSLLLFCSLVWAPSPSPSPPPRWCVVIYTWRAFIGDGFYTPHPLWRNLHATAVALPTIVPLFSRTVEIWAAMTFERRVHRP